MATKVQNNNRFTALLVWSCITLFYCYQSILRVLPNIIMPNVMNQYNVGATEFGSFSGLYYIGYISAHIPIGIFLSRFGAKIVIPLCIACTALGLAPLVYYDTWWTVLLGRTLTGVGSSAAAVGALQIFRVLYATTFVRMIGAMVSLGLITTVYASASLLRTIQSIGLNTTINLLLYLGIGLAIITYLFTPKSANKISHTGIWTDIKAIISNYNLLLISLFAGLMLGPMEGFADAWGSAFIISIYGIDKITADSIIFSILLGMCAGCIILPYIVEKTGLYFGITIFSGIGMLICFIYILSGNANVESLYYTCIITGILCAYQIIMLAKITTLVSVERSGMASAIANMIIMMFGWIFHNSIGRILDYSWNGERIDGVKFYSSDAFINGISIIPYAMCIAIIGLSVMALLQTIEKRVKRSKPKYKSSPSNLNMEQNSDSEQITQL
jgi:MFS family permease